jgi:hypothetical protein
MTPKKINTIIIAALGMILLGLSVASGYTHDRDNEECRASGGIPTLVERSGYECAPQGAREGGA